MKIRLLNFDTKCADIFDGEKVIHSVPFEADDVIWYQAQACERKAISHLVRSVIQQMQIKQTRADEDDFHAIQKDIDTAQYIKDLIDYEVHWLPKRDYSNELKELQEGNRDA